MKEGKKPLTEEEMKAKLQAMRDEELEQAKKKLEETQKRKDETVRRLVEGAFKA
jgi:glutamyl-tRNA reductase